MWTAKVHVGLFVCFVVAAAAVVVVVVIVIVVIIIVVAAVAVEDFTLGQGHRAM